MAKRYTIKDHLRETQLFNGRAGAALIVITILAFSLIARLLYLQIFSHEHFTMLSQKNRVSLIALPPTRGLIYDRNGTLLAQNLPSFSLEVVPEQVKDMDATLGELRKLIEINDSDIKRFKKLLQQKRRFESVPLRFHLSDEEVAKFAYDRFRFPGVDIEARLVRDYPMGPRAVHLIGYVGRINEVELQQLDASVYSGISHIGKTGVEKSYEDVLHGIAGFKQVEINAMGRSLRTLEVKPPTPGKNLYLTIDAALQAAAEDAFGERRGALVAIDPNNGDVLALVSTPTFNPNPFVNGIEVDDYAALEKSPSKPLYNRALRGQYPPGSTVKPFMGLAGLDNGKISSEDTTYCPGFYSLKGSKHRYRDWKHTGHGSTNLAKAIAESCDVYFYDLALTLGIDHMHSFLSQFGFGQKTGIDIPGELAALLPSRQWKQKARKQIWYPGETLIVGIGQGYTLATPLQLASATATMATRGNHMRPRVVKAIQEPDRSRVAIIDPMRINSIRLKNRNYWDQVIDAMTQVVHAPNGTAKAIGATASFRIAGKTGTAQVYGLKQNEKYNAQNIPEELRDHALFVAFAPAEAPRIAIALIVENGGSGSGTAAPLARQIIDHYLLASEQHDYVQVR